MPGLFDHVLASLLLVVWPVWVALKGRDGIHHLAENPSERLHEYRVTIAVQWAHAAAILGLWWALGRSATDLGLGLSLDGRFAIAAALTAAVTWGLWSQWRRVHRDPGFAAELRDQLGHMESFVPSTPAEIRAVRALSVTAGICEELACRGFLLWYLASYVHVSVAIGVMAIAFGASHLYQGPKAAAQIAGIGVVAALLYLLSGSLWLPMLLHALLDLSQMSMARAALDARPDRGSAPAVA